ncbi:MAG: ParB/RepB/Spo0J family partition protein [Thermaceae bacterium]|nr:ParB/RepB/Spo0J family partition protein [Thermaceae bacterium]
MVTTTRPAPKSAASPLSDRPYLADLPIANLLPDPDNERTSLDPQGLDELAASIQARGILEPLCVYMVDATGTGTFRILSGHRRREAAKLADLTHLPCYVVPDPTSNADRHIDRLTTNLQRRDIAPLDKARGLRKALDAGGMTQADLARQLGISQPSVANTIRLLDLPDEIKAMLDDGHLTMGHGIALLAVTEPSLTYSGTQLKTLAESQISIAQSAATYSTSVKSLQEQIANHNRTAASARTYAQQQKEYNESSASEIAARDQRARTQTPEKQAQLEEIERKRIEAQATRELRRTLAQTAIEGAMQIPPEGPTYKHLRLAALLLADSIYNWDADSVKNLGLDARIIKQLPTMRGQDELIAMIARLALAKANVIPDSDGLHVSEYAKGPLANTTFNLNKAIQAALSEAGLWPNPEKGGDAAN